MINVACCLWDPNRNSKDFSRRYDEEWVEKLYRAFQRNLTVPFKFIVFTDRRRDYLEEAIHQHQLMTRVPDYGCLIEPFCLNEPTIICGLDTVILKNLDHMAEYCMDPRNKVAQPNHPSLPGKKINPVVFVPPGNRGIFDRWCGENDMDWLQIQDTVPTDDLWPGEIVSLKLHDVRRKGVQGASIVYFHGEPKADEMLSTDWVREHWR